MEVPYGINNTKNVVCRLDKAIYDCVYVNLKEDTYVYVCPYVDDMIIAAKTGEETQEVKTALKNALNMKERGEAKFILGITTTRQRLTISQTRYIDDVVNRFNQQDAKVVENPCEARLKLTKTQSPKTEAEILLMQGNLYRALVGYLLYIPTCTRPDVAHRDSDIAIRRELKQQHWKAAIRVVGYLESTRVLGTAYNDIKRKVKLPMCTAADWGSNHDDTGRYRVP
ncbi:polyprotein [Phytophthora megakarya]|uniref:Polyprotein n=1 Tax=Phytophthora megakarya TaxID=4795 RepID=A0A225WYY2_9STRA|nr:polyprotein [Phytophthora megakarya]